jgi:Fic family protein
VRGHNKDRGNFRKIENWIGFTGATKEQASYIPPSPDKMVIALDNWEKYIHLESEEILIQLAVIHAQFEIIHPFLDGNGRIGRILIPLFLYAKKYLDFPAFYMSEYLESCRSEYYARLKNISENNDWQGWIEFFLRAIIEQSKIGKNRVDRVLELYNSTKRIVAEEIGSSVYCLQIAEFIFQKPIFTVNDFLPYAMFYKIDNDGNRDKKDIYGGIGKVPNKSTVIRILNELSEINILKKHEGKGSKPSSYEFVELLNIVENRV